MSLAETGELKRDRSAEARAAEMLEREGHTILGVLSSPTPDELDEVLPLLLEAYELPLSAVDIVRIY